MFGDRNTNNAIRFAHISAIIPVWGLLVAFVCYKYISNHAPDRRESVIEPFAWQAGLTIFHFVCLLILLISDFVSACSPPFIVVATMLVIWITVFVFSLITSFTAAKNEVQGQRFRYPIFSSLIRKQRRNPDLPKGSIFYPFEDYMEWK